MCPEYSDDWKVRGGGGAIDFGPHVEAEARVSVGGSPFLRCTTDYGDEDRFWLWRHNKGNTCPGPGFGEPECGKIIDNDAERCNSCRTLHDHYVSTGDPRDRIRERPLREIDSVQYGHRLRARMQARRLVELARKKRGEQ